MPVFLFTDIENSTQLWENYPEQMRRALARHDAIIKAEIKAGGGIIIKHTGDGVFAIFTGGDPLKAALAIEKKMQSEKWGEISEIRVRIALHIGEAFQSGQDFFGPTINRTNRILSTGWGGQILLSAETAAISKLPDKCQLKDLGSHQLKDLDLPVQIFQLVCSDLALQNFPPLKSLSAHPHNLPPQSTPFINRVQETDEIHKVLESPTCRVLTIIGPGGMGKTRLALQVAVEHVDQFANGVFYVPLASVNSPDYLIPSLAEALKFQFYSEKDPKQQLFDYLRHKEILLILDNFEHVISGATLLSELTDVATKLKIIATSRERLNLQVERIYEIGGLGFGGESGKEDDEMSAVMLYLYVAQRTDPNFTLNKENYPAVRSICKLLGGLPLGIELAASLTRLLNPEEIAGGLESDLDSIAGTFRDLPERHRSLKSAFEYSWKMLSPELQALYARLSVFQGGFERDAAEKVTGAKLQDLSALMDKSLLRRNANGRYEILEVLRRFAENYLDEQNKKDTLQKYCEYYANFLALNESELYRKTQMKSLKLLGQEIENLRQAWLMMISFSRNDLLVKSADCLFYYYVIKSRYEEAKKLLETAYNKAIAGKASANEKSTEQILAIIKVGRILGRIYCILVEKEKAAVVLNRSLGLAKDLNELKEQANCLIWLGDVSRLNNDFGEAQELLEQSIELFEKLKDEIGIATAMVNLGSLATSVGKYENAQQYLLKSLAIAKKYNDKISSVGVLTSLVWISYQKGNYDVAMKIGQEALQIAEEIESKKDISLIFLHLGSVAYTQGNLDEARRLYQDSLTIGQEIGEQGSIKSAINNLAGIAIQQKDYSEAKRLLLEFLEINKETGQLRGVAVALHNLGHIELQMKNVEEAERYLLESLAIRRQIQELPGVASSLINLSSVQFEKGEIKTCLSSSFEALHLAIQIKALPLILRCLTHCATIFIELNHRYESLRIYKTLFARSETPQELKDMANENINKLRKEATAEEFTKLDEIATETDLDTLVNETMELLNALIKEAEL